MNWEVHVRGKARKTILRFPGKDRQRVQLALHEIAVNPFGGDMEKMKGEENTWRRRIGAYRIFYEVRAQEKVLYVYRIERRTSKTY